MGGPLGCVVGGLVGGLSTSLAGFGGGEETKERSKRTWPTVVNETIAGQRETDAEIERIQKALKFLRGNLDDFQCVPAGSGPGVRSRT